MYMRTDPHFVFAVISAVVAVTAAYSPSPTPGSGEVLREAANDFAIRLLQVSAVAVSDFRTIENCQL